MNKKSNPYIIIIVFLLCLIAGSCRSQIDFIIIPIREAEFREEQCLPLDSTKIDKILEFIEDGGEQKNDGFKDKNSGELKPFKEFLLILTIDDNLTYGYFIGLPELKEFIDPENPVRDVIDAREKKGPQGINRLAYRYKDFWFVLMVDKLCEDGRPILDKERKFSRLIVMKALDVTEKEK